MLVDHVGLAAFDAQILGLLIGNGGNEFESRIASLDGVVKLGETIIIAKRAVEPIFIADFNVGELERGGMAVLRTPSAPPCVGSAGYIFDFLQRLFNERL